MPNVSSINEVYLKSYSGSFVKNSNAYIGRSNSESTNSDVVLQKIISLYIHYPSASNTGYDGTLEIRISPDSVGTAGHVIFSCKIKPGETIIPISKKVQPIYLSSAERILAKLSVDGSATNATYIMSVEELRST